MSGEKQPTTDSTGDVRRKDPTERSEPRLSCGRLECQLDFNVVRARVYRPRRSQLKLTPLHDAHRKDQALYMSIAVKKGMDQTKNVKQSDSLR